MTWFDVNDTIGYNEIMHTVNIRKLPTSVHQRLRVRAAKAGRSMEAEARAIITKAVCGEVSHETPSVDLRDLISRMYDKKLPSHVVDDLISERCAEAQRESRVGKKRRK